MDWYRFHTWLLLGGFAALVIAVLAAVMYLIQSAQLKSRHPGRLLAALPSLASLDKLHFVALAWGVVLFSLGILTGVFWAKDIQELGQAFRDPQVRLSFLTCLLSWVVLSVRLSALRRGQKIAVGTLFVFILLFASFFAPSALHGGL